MFYDFDCSQFVAARKTNPKADSIITSKSLAEAFGANVKTRNNIAAVKIHYLHQHCDKAWELFEFEDQTTLTRVGNGYFLPPQGVEPVPAVDTTVAQGHLESSNTTPSTEMSTLMLALRHYEANQKVIQITDERMGKTIQELASTT